MAERYGDFPPYGQEAVTRPLSRSVDDVFGILKRKGQPPVAVDAMNAAIRQRLAREVRP